MTKILILLLMSFTLIGPAMAQDNSAPDPSQYQLTEYVSGLSRPLYLTHAGDGSNRLFVLEQAGRIIIVSDGIEYRKCSEDTVGQYCTTALIFKLFLLVPSRGGS